MAKIKFRLNTISNQKLRDPVIKYIGANNFKKLSKEEGELKALNVYQKRKLTKREIGLKYERYLQFYFETKGNWDVYNNGIRKGYKDLGRDLICIKNNTIRIIQAKYWSVSKKIYSKHIHQLHGSAASYKYCKNNFQDYNIQKYFCFRNQIDEEAKKQAKYLDIKLKKIEMPKLYPMIKCNISKRGKKYFLPFDSYYDQVKISKDKGEFYCSEPIQAIKSGFIRS